ncbi:MAG: hypothetical protein EXR75_08940 [Myxococcales bacterium]|nr:hypothetical protein [Myxococcales bacterium]
MARTFICSVAYELGPETTDEAARLLRAELVARGFRDRQGERPLPRNAVWMPRVATEDDTTDSLHDACTRDLRLAAAAVRAGGRTMKLLRAWIQVSGGGTYGLAAGELDSPAA